MNMDANMIDPRWFVLGDYWPGFVSGRLRGLREMVSSEPDWFDAVCRQVTAREPCAGADRPAMTARESRLTSRLPGVVKTLSPAGCREELKRPPGNIRRPPGSNRLALASEGGKSKLLW